MPTNVIMPALGMDQDKGTLVRWIKHEGDSVQHGEPIMEVETDKALVEIEATASGVLTNVTAVEGEEIPVGKVIAEIVEGSAPTPTPSPIQGEGLTARPTAARPLASPKARRLAS